MGRILQGSAPLMRAWLESVIWDLICLIGPDFCSNERTGFFPQQRVEIFRVWACLDSDPSPADSCGS